MPKGVRGFQKGAQWNGNKEGRPLSTPREIFTNKYFKDNEERIWKNWDNIMELALEKKEKWAMERVADTWTSRPRIEVPPEMNSQIIEIISEAKNFLSDFSCDTLQRMQSDRSAALERRTNNKGEELREEQNG